ncbi:MAG: NAD(P)/FAD-dependent oxidoreductase [Nitrososphaerales archaeon]
MSVDYDVIIVGAGPAGSSAAISCAKVNSKTLLIERSFFGRHKPCGGILPPITLYIFDELGINIPSKVFCNPKSLKLFYIPPSGKLNGGALKCYKLLNINRDLFDKWLVEEALNKGVDFQTNSTVISFKQDDDNVEVKLRCRDENIRVTAKYLLAADGTHSIIRKCFEGAYQKFLIIMQEYWKCEGEFEDCFYTILSKRITPTYGYVVPKDNAILIGSGAKDLKQSIQSLENLKNWLKEEFKFKPQSLIKREIGFIPYDKCFIGMGRVILLGDAAGFCNKFSGEGVRFALESGLIASKAIEEAENKGVQVSEAYAKKVQPLLEFIEKTKSIINIDTDKWREEFVLNELKRLNIWQR